MPNEKNMLSSPEMVLNNAKRQLTNRVKSPERLKSNDTNKSFDSSKVNIVSGELDCRDDDSLILGESAQLTAEQRHRLILEEAMLKSNLENHKIEKCKPGKGQIESSITWQAKFRLQSHMDSVRCVLFHPEELQLITAGEDCLVKLWELSKNVSSKKPLNYIHEPLSTFRAHTSPVLSLALSSNGNLCYSGSLTGGIECWSLSSSERKLYGSYNPSEHFRTLSAHSDAVWGLAAKEDKLFSCSSDGAVFLWDPLKKKALLKCFSSNASCGVPTSINLVQNKLDSFLVGYNNAQCFIYDTETGQKIIRMKIKKSWAENPAKAINKVISHPILPITITGHDDGHIYFWDNKIGQVVHSMTAHELPITSLAIDTDGLYLLSCSHDCSVKLWCWDSKECVQVLEEHRKKLDEGIYDVAFHSTKPYIASAGADNVVKVYI